MDIAENMDQRLSLRLKSLRQERNMSLESLAAATGVSRATLSRLENAEVSPTASVLGKLCAAYGLTMSRLLYMVEQSDVGHIRASEQVKWQDAETGFQRVSVSPPSQELAGEVIACVLQADTRIAYDRPARMGLEQHIVLTEGTLLFTVDGATHSLKPGDCFRYKLYGPTAFETPVGKGAKYFIFIV